MQIRPNFNNADRSNEQKIVARVKSGDFTAIEELYERYSRQAFGLALKILNSSESAEDAVQDAFLRFWKQPDNFDPQRGRFATWLLSVVHNLCIDQIRRKRPNVVSLDQEETQERLNYLADDSFPLEEEVWLKIQRKAIAQAMSQLPPEQRGMIELAFFKGLTHNEIALQTGQPLGTVKSRIRQGLIKLKNLMQDVEAESNK
jgi:RNA polymerase sigma-70 factor (ECF subfamily)